MHNFRNNSLRAEVEKIAKSKSRLQPNPVDLDTQMRRREELRTIVSAAAEVASSLSHPEDTILYKQIARSRWTGKLLLNKSRSFVSGWRLVESHAPSSSAGLWDSSNAGGDSPAHTGVMLGQDRKLYLFNTLMGRLEPRYSPKHAPIKEFAYGPIAMDTDPEALAACKPSIELNKWNMMPLLAQLAVEGPAFKPNSTVGY